MSFYDTVFNLIKFCYLYKHKYSSIEILGGFTDIDQCISKKRMIFLVNFRGRRFVIKNHPMNPIVLKKNPVFISVSSIIEFLDIIKDNEIENLQMLTDKQKCTCKIFDYPGIKVYKYCKGERNNNYTISWMDKY